MKDSPQAKGRRARKGFTLIELLIVVAIIAILAAIAIPNFLEAQIRAKVSRAKSDMRTIGIGVETYSIDYGRAPIGVSEAGEMTDVGSGIYWGSTANGCNVPVWYPFLMKQFTTPVAYLDSYPYDPFISKGYFNYQCPADNLAKTGGRYSYYSIHRDTPATPKSAISNRSPHVWLAGSVGPDKLMGYAAANDPYKYMSYCVVVHGQGGPGVGAGTGGLGFVTNVGIYDPTNGTVSAGHLMRTNVADLNDRGRY